MRNLLPLIALLLACKTGPQPAKQNPSPMTEHARSHERVVAKPVVGKRFTIDGVLPKAVEVLITPAAEQAGRGDLVLHFHGSAQLPMQAAEESGKPLIVAVVNLGAGSSRYSRPFRDPQAFTQLIERLSTSVPTIEHIYLTGFSAGYGAIREILRQTPDTIAGVLLLDGLHTSYIPEGKPLAEGGRLEESGLEPFFVYAQRAVRGEKRLVITHSEIFPGTFASTTETTDWLLNKLGIERKPVVQWGPHGMQQLSEADAGALTVLGFAGNSAPDHIDHLHGYAEFLRMLLSEAPQAAGGSMEHRLSAGSPAQAESLCSVGDTAPTVSE